MQYDANNELEARCSNHIDGPIVTDSATKSRMYSVCPITLRWLSLFHLCRLQAMLERKKHVGNNGKSVYRSSSLRKAGL